MANRTTKLELGAKVRIHTVERSIAWAQGRTGTVTNVVNPFKLRNYMVCIKLDIVHAHERETIPFKRDYFYIYRNQLEVL